MQATNSPSIASAYVPTPEAAAPAAPDPYADIAAYVNYQWQQAKQHRAGKIYGELLHCLEQRRGEYSAEEMVLISEDLRTFLRATDVKCRAGKAFMMEVYDATEGKFWELEPTPVPEVPDWLKEFAYKKLQQELLSLGPQAMVRDHHRQ